MPPEPSKKPAVEGDRDGLANRRGGVLHDQGQVDLTGERREILPEFVLWQRGANRRDRHDGVTTGVFRGAAKNQRLFRAFRPDTRDDNASAGSHFHHQSS